VNITVQHTRKITATLGDGDYHPQISVGRKRVKVYLVELEVSEDKHDFNRIYSVLAYGRAGGGTRISSIAIPPLLHGIIENMMAAR
jgi:hypothetical protein